ncbi:transcription factor Adf-1 [Nilaparvata lugens]|uniref:transcription factor Adf-1 n=1 Tax=Nilaparvata lugens TaxID=108931 RepID=UPI000B99D20D|nr:transcription factor Adf-1 [Nilaparvata lugens]
MLDDELLIELVRGQPALYDFTHTHYSDATFKIQKWQELGQILKQDADKVKTRWESLRNQFRRFIRLKKKKSAGRYAGPLANWKHYEGMQFLKPHMREKKRASDETADDHHVYWPTGDDTADDTTQRSQELEVEISPSPIVGSNSHHLRSYLTKPKSPETPADDGNTASILLKYILDKERTRKERQAPDDIDLFFDSIKATVKKLSDKNKILAKQRVFTIVNELEGINLNEMQHLSAAGAQAQYCQQTLQYPSHSHHSSTS